MANHHMAKRTGTTKKGKSKAFWKVVTPGGLERHAVRAGTNPAKYYLYKVMAPDAWRNDPKNFNKPRSAWKLKGMVSESLEYRERKDGGGHYILRTATQTEVIFDPAKYLEMAQTVDDLVPAEDATVRDIFDQLIERNKKLKLKPYMGMQLPIYGADISGSLFVRSAPGINLKTLRKQNLLEEIIREAKPVGGMYDGVSDPMLYFGMSGTVFAMHLEDMNLCSVAYLHEGAPKVWWVIPPEYRRQVEHLLRRMVQDEDRQFSSAPGVKTKCNSLRHKNIIIPPKVLASEGQYVFLEPGAVHFGMNLGWNLSEALNFATDDWVQDGIEVFGRVYDRVRPDDDDDVAALCYCQKRDMHFDRDALDQVVKFPCIPIENVCRKRRKRRTAHLQRLIRGLHTTLREHSLPIPNESLVNAELKALEKTDLYDPQPPVRHRSALDAIGIGLPESAEPIPIAEPSTDALEQPDVEGPKSVCGLAFMRPVKTCQVSPGIVRGTLNTQFWSLWEHTTLTFSQFARMLSNLSPLDVEYMYVC